VNPGVGEVLGLEDLGQEAVVDELFFADEVRDRPALGEGLLGKSGGGLVAEVGRERCDDRDGAARRPRGACPRWR
jgi:hypothetical protein